MILSLGEPRISKSITFQPLYGSKSGDNVKVTVPVIANPSPEKSALMWLGPVPNLGIPFTVSKQDVPFKHWINSSIPIIDQNYFGNYTLKYNMIEVVNITINAEGKFVFLSREYLKKITKTIVGFEHFPNFVYLIVKRYSYFSDVPQVPINFTGYSYAGGYIHLAWVSRFDGGKPQYFILSKKHDLGWKEVANMSDPGQGKEVSFESERLNPGKEYRFQLKSCNIINCSKESVELKMTVKGKIDIQ